LSSRTRLAGSHGGPLSARFDVRSVSAGPPCGPARLCKHEARRTGAVIVHGGPSRGLSQIMPAFGDPLTDGQMNDVIAYMRGFCKNVHRYPLGELNLPRALVTEKAFPENEIVVSTAANASGAPAWTMSGRSSMRERSLRPIDGVWDARRKRVIEARKTAASQTVAYRVTNPI
jgi:hypothetical protein